MLTADMVHARRRGDTLELLPLAGKARDRAAELADVYLALARDCVGRSRGEWEQACDAVPVSVRERKLANGMRKLVADGCEIEADTGVDPVSLRRHLFELAARRRRELDEGQTLDRGAVLAEAVGELGMDPDRIELSLYADLRDSHTVRSAEPASASSIVDRYELAQQQAVLLRAEEVCVDVICATPADYRSLFRKLKFRRLLHRIEPLAAGGYRLHIDGPMSLFTSVTKYGLALALVLPAIRRADRWSVEARVRWGKARRRLLFRASGGAGESRTGAPETADLPDEVAILLERIAKLDTPWQARVAEEILELPGLGLCVPDLCLIHRETGEVAFVEVLGYWSREAVWRRVELVRAGLPHRIVFAVSSRLRVSEAVLRGNLPGELYVYKGTMSARALIDRLDQSRLAPTHEVTS